MIVEQQKILLPTKAAHTLAVTKFQTQTSIDKTLIISSATGVLQHFYSSFASYFASVGFIVFTFDYWGIGASGSSLDQLKENDSNLREWGSIDQSAITAFAKIEHPNNELILIAHSIGGQITGFNTNYRLLDKLILVASQNGHWRHFKGLGRLKMWLFWYFLLPSLTNVFGYFPAKMLGLFENLPKNMALEWAHWGRRRNYFMHDYDCDAYFFDRMKLPLLSFSFPRDPFAPAEAVAWLTEQFTNANANSIHYIPGPDEQKRIGHFGFFRTAYKDTLWRTVQEWINNS